jgi:hypothetical protein
MISKFSRQYAWKTFDEGKGGNQKWRRSGN